MNKVTAKSFTIDSLARLEEKKFRLVKASRNLIRLTLSITGRRCPNRCFRCKTVLDRVKDKDYINVNLTYELDKLTKGISNSVVVSGH